MPMTSLYEGSGNQNRLSDCRESCQAEQSSSSAMLLCLCDGGKDIGFGHVSRCLALAEAFEEHGWLPRFAGRLIDGAEELVAKAGYEVTFRPLRVGQEEVAEAVTLCHEWDAAAVMLDSYAIRPHYLGVLAAAFPVLLIDDYGALAVDEYARLIVLNPSIIPDSVSYPSAHFVLSGPRYIPFRRALRSKRPSQLALRPQVQRVLVTLGGGDPQNLTQRVVQALAEAVPTVDVVAVVGRGYVWREQLEASLKSCGKGSRTLVQVPNLAELLAETDLLVCGGGMTKFEAAYMGVPALVISLNESQTGESAVFSRLDLVIDLGLGVQLSSEALRQTLQRVTQDAVLRSELAHRGWQTFPADPTSTVVDAFVGELATRMNRKGIVLS
jgi:UDP-2,4-diacetamido-2,4,6-trideoxy-beta-L-altropyranose hydrolase